MREQRNTGLDLLKIVLMFMICMLHIINKGGMLVDNDTCFSYYSVRWLRSFCLCAVDCFAIISGYFGKNKKLNFNRILILYIEALFYSVFCYFVICIFINRNQIILSDLLKCFMPINFGNNWYFRDYFIIFFVTPFFNYGVNLFNKKQCNIMLIVMLVFSINIVLVKDQWFNGGYSAFWLLYLYIGGLLLKEAEILSNLSKKRLCIYYFICCLFTWILETCLKQKNWQLYTSPSVLLSAVFLLLLFSKIKITNKKYIKYIQTISPLTFGVYLLHDNIYFSNSFIQDKFTFISSYNPFMQLPMIITFTLIVYTICMIVDYARNRIFNIINIDAFVEKTLIKLSNKV